MNSNDINRMVVAAGIIWKHDCFLATQRQDNKPFAGYWELPGGKLEDNEKPGEALCRELAEELGINVRKYRLIKVIEHEYKESNFIAELHFFEVTEFDGEPCPKEEQNLRWIRPDQSTELDFLPGDAEILAQITADCKKK